MIQRPIPGGVVGAKKKDSGSRAGQGESYTIVR